jgi:hypothetical protein
MDVPLHSARAAVRILLLFGIKESIHHRFVPGEHFSFKKCLPVGATTLGEPWPPLQPVSTWC